MSSVETSAIENDDRHECQARKGALLTHSAHNGTEGQFTIDHASGTGPRALYVRSDRRGSSRPKTVADRTGGTGGDRDSRGATAPETHLASVPAPGGRLTRSRTGQLATFDGALRRGGRRTAHRPEGVDDRREPGHACAHRRSEEPIFVSRRSDPGAVGGRHDGSHRCEQRPIRGPVVERLESTPTAGSLDLEGIERTEPTN